MHQDKSKKPLPSTTTTLAIPEDPQTPYEWRYVLKFIKVQYQKGQWRQCLGRCNQLLSAELPPLPLHTACLHFYAALSEEAIAHQMHDMSLAKNQAFQQAKFRFEQAASTLPIPDKHDKENESLSADSGSEVDDTVSLEDSISSVAGSHPCSVPSSPLSKQFEQQVSISPSLRPTPLQICKIGQQSKNSFNEKRAFFESRLQTSKSSPSISPALKTLALDKPLPMPPPSKRSFRKLSHPRSVSDLRSTSTVTSLQSSAQERYNDQLLEFAQMLTKHIEYVNKAVTKTREAQASGRRCLMKDRRIEANEDEDLFNLRVRIANLKKKGWVRDRFAPAKYQEICEKALADL